MNQTVPVNDKNIFPNLVMSDTDPEFLHLRRDSDFKREYAGEKDAKVRNAYYSILRASNSEAVNAYFSLDNELDSLNYPRALVLELLDKHYIQQIFYIEYDITKNQLVLRNLLVAGSTVHKCWQVALSRSLQQIAHFIVKEKELDRMSLRQIFSEYNAIQFLDEEIPPFPDFPLLNRVTDLGNPNATKIKEEFFNIIRLSLTLHPNYIQAPGIGFFFVMPEKVRDFLPYLDRKLDRVYTYRIPTLNETCLEEFKKAIGLYFSVKQNKDFVHLTPEDLFYVKVHFLANYKMSHFVNRTRLLFDFIQNTAIKLKTYENKKLQDLPKKKVKVIKTMLSQNNHFLSRILKIDIEDEILDGSVIDHLYGDPEIMHVNYYDAKNIFIVFVQKNVENIKNLMITLSNQKDAFEHSLLLEKVLEKYPQVKSVIEGSENYKYFKLFPLYNYLARDLSPLAKIIHFLVGKSIKEKFVNRNLSQFRLNQLNFRMKHEAKLNKEKEKKLDDILSSIFTQSEDAMKMHISESLAEMKLIDSQDIDFLKKLCSNIDEKFIELWASKVAVTV